MQNMYDTLRELSFMQKRINIPVWSIKTKICYIPNTSMLPKMSFSQLTWLWNIHYNIKYDNKNKYLNKVLHKIIFPHWIKFFMIWKRMFICIVRIHPIFHCLQICCHLTSSFSRKCSTLCLSSPTTGGISPFSIKTFFSNISIL